MSKKKRELRGIRMNSENRTSYHHLDESFLDLTVDCHLGSLVITKSEILDHFENKGLLEKEINKRAGWRDVQGELPKRDGIVLVYCPSQDPEKGLTALAWYNPEKGWSQMPNVWLDAITHWQPIPAPPMKTKLQPKAEA